MRASEIVCDHSEDAPREADQFGEIKETKSKKVSPKPSEEESELFVCVDKDIYKFAKLVADKAFQDGYEKGVAAFNEAVLIEREACAKLCDKEVEDWKYDADVVDVAIAIRARGEATHPPQRTWVGLTVEEIAACCMESTTTQLSFYNAIEAKLKEKNT